jgi:hypothetical protein
MSKHHLIISGTGRAGTTFLVQLLTELGLQTGFKDAFSDFHASCNAGMEWNLRLEDAPYVVKSPELCEYLGEVLKTKDIVIDYAIVPVRDLYSAAESRRQVSQASGRKKGAKGGLWLTKNPRAQEAVLAKQFCNLVRTLVEHDVPTIFLDFPRLVKDSEYLFTKLKPALPNIGSDAFSRAFQKLSNPRLVHQFSNRQESSQEGSLFSRLRKLVLP